MSKQMELISMKKGTSRINMHQSNNSLFQFFFHILLLPHMSYKFNWQFSQFTDAERYFSLRNANEKSRELVPVPTPLNTS